MGSGESVATKNEATGRRLPERMRVFWDTRGRPWWSAYQAVFVAAVAIATLALAFVGTGGFEPHAPLSDRLLRLLSVFGLGYPLLGPFDHPAAKTARWLAAGVTIATIAKVWSALFRTQIGVLASRWRSDHAIVCGLGEAGTAVGLSLRSAGIPVVGIDRSEESGAGRFRTRGMAALVGDARDEVVLRMAGIERARFLVAFLGDDQRNAEVLASARRILGQRARKPLTCVIHVSDLALRRLIRAAEFAAGPDDPIRLQCVNLEEHGARALLAEWPPPRAGAGGGAPHVLLVGLGRFGESVLLQLARRFATSEGGGKLMLSVVDRNAADRCEELFARQPGLASRCDVEPFSVSTRSAEFEGGAIWSRVVRRAPLDAAYVCLAETESAVAAALALHAQAGGRRVPITLRTRRELGLAALIEGGPIGAQDSLRVFPSLARTCTADLVLRGTNERLAEALHEQYLQRAQASSELRGAGALRPWAELSEEGREANRVRADQIASLLRDAGMRLAPLNDWDAEPAVLGAEEVERLGELEHRRWLEWRRREGWSYGAARDDDRKVTPLLVPWDALPEPERERNRAEICALPALLALADLAIARADAG